MQENIILTIFSAVTFLTSFSLYLFFRRFRQHKASAHRLLRLVSGNVLVLLFLFSILLLAGEIYFRFIHDTTDSFGLTKTTQKWFSRHFQLNNASFRDSVSYSIHIPPGQRRITFLGDSFTAGHGVPDVEDRFVNRVRQMRSGWDVQMLAQCGWDTGHEVAFLENSIRFDYQLDVVVLVYCLNDLADIVPDWAATLDRIYRSSELGFWGTNSYLFNTLYYSWKVSRDPDVIDYYRVVKRHYEGHVWAEQQKRLKRLRDEVNARNGHLVVVTFPFIHALGKEYPYRHSHECIGKFWDVLNVPHLDLLSEFQHRNTQALVVNSRDAHPNEQAHALAAQAIVSFLDIHLTPKDTLPTD